jgi:predicted amidohydrolase YtcJ
MRIDACFDSHVHWPATGEFSQRLQLSPLTSPDDILKVPIQDSYRRGEWILGFGWDEAKWTEAPTRAVLDKWCPDRPVALSRCDGHALWVNTYALKLCQLERAFEVAGGRMETDSTGMPTGVLVDRAADLVSRHIPRPTGIEMRRHLLHATKTFNSAGFTHIRDMTCDEAQWNEAVRLDEAGLLTLAVEEYFWLKSADHIESVVELVEKAKRSASENLRAKGVKIFLDGALGSDGAWLSKCYHGKSHQGLILWEDAALTEVLLSAWRRQQEVAVHAIGDEAVARIVDLACELFDKGTVGRLHIEHGELIRPDTIEKMKRIPVECHMQPSHWLSDHKWLEQKIGDLATHAFPWRALQEANVPIDFGSDSPIEVTSLARTFLALAQSAENGVPRLLGSPSSYMGHKDLSWAANSYTILDRDHQPQQVVFRGTHLQ